MSEGHVGIISYRDGGFGVSCTSVALADVASVDGVRSGSFIHHGRGYFRWL